MQTLTTSESIAADVERACAEPQALLRLVRSLLEYAPESPWQQTYVASLVWYVFYKRRRDIAKQRGKVLGVPLRQNSGCGPRVDYEIARDAARECERELTAEIGEEAVKDLKKRVGKQLSLATCAHRILEGKYDVI